MSSKPRIRPLATIENARGALRAGQKVRGKGDAPFQVFWWWKSWRLAFVGAWPSPLIPIYRWTLRVGPLELRRWGP